MNYRLINWQERAAKKAARMSRRKLEAELEKSRFILAQGIALNSPLREGWAADVALLEAEIARRDGSHG